MLTDTMYLFDRNIITVIKHANEGVEQKGPKQQRMLKFLRSIDAPQYSVSPLLSLVEGEHAGEDGEDEKIVQLHKETSAIASFFRHASTDKNILKKLQEQFRKVFTNFREESFSAREEFRERAAPLVLQIVSPRDRHDVEDKLVALAQSVGLATDDAVVVLFLACLYGSNAARKVLKPSKVAESYNVLSDIHTIYRVGQVMSVAKHDAPSLKIHFLTLDEGLESVLRHIRIATRGNIGEFKVNYLPGLFTGLTEIKARALIQRINPDRR